MEVSELIAAKEIFFRQNDINDDDSRKRELVYARGAFAMAFRCVAGPSVMGKVLGRDHASIVHYGKNHDTLKHYEDYKNLYEAAVELRESLFKREDLPNMTHSDLIRIIRSLRNELRLEKEKVKELYIYKDKFFKLKELIWLFASPPLSGLCSESTTLIGERTDMKK